MSSSLSRRRPSRLVVGAAVASAILLAAQRPIRAQGVPALPPSVTYVLPLLGSYLSLSSADFQAKVLDLRARLAPNGEGPLARVGFTAYIRISMDDWTIDTGSPAAVRAALATTIGQIDGVVAKAVASNTPVCLSFLTAIRDRYDPAQTASEREDRRNTQWYTDNGLAAGWWTHSQYARRQRTVQEAYIRELGKVLAHHMAQYPEIVVAATGDGEVELSFDRWLDISQTEPPSWADYSPFAIAEFRDWLRGAGLYAAGQPLAGEGYSQRDRYTADPSPAVAGADGHSLNGDLGTAFTSWDLRYFDWSLADDPGADPHAIPQSVYGDASWNPMPTGRGPEYFDAPRVRNPGDPWWEAWVRFRQELVQRHNRDFAKWMTTSVDPATGATVPPERWYSDQVPADYLFGNPPPDQGVRLATSASPSWTSDITPYGCAGITSYNANLGGGSYARTLVNAAPVVAARNPCWGLTEWNPSDPWTSDPAIYREDTALVERYRPRLLIPFAWDDTTHWRVADSGFEVALRELIARIGKPQLTVDRSSLRFGVVLNSLAGGPQDVTIGQAGPGSVTWTAVSDRAWLQVSPRSGTAPGRLSIQVSATDPGLQSAGTFTGRVSVSSPDAGNSVAIDVVVAVAPNGTTAAPFGQMDTPLPNTTGVVGAIGVTGWALDDVGVTGVKIYRNCMPFEPQANCQAIDGHSVVYIGDAAFLAGARPDVESAFPGYPQAHRAGWGYLMLTNMLPHVPGQQGYGGQGPVTLFALASDVDGHRTLLGRSRLDHLPTAITLANDTIAKPFGAIDTPGQGQTVSGVVANFGWALTPDANTASGDADIEVPTDGSTMKVVIDGVAAGSVTYNQCRGSVGNPVPGGAYCNDDVANIFGNPTPQPTFTPRAANATRYRNLDVGRAAIGSYDIDTRTLSNGLHTIAWGVLDSAGRAEGIGSRFFMVLNGTIADAAADVPVYAGSGPTYVGSGFSRTAAQGAVADEGPAEAGPHVRESAVAGPHGPGSAEAGPHGRAAQSVTALREAPAVARGDARSLDGLVAWTGEIAAATGFDFDAPLDVLMPGADGIRRIQLDELGRLELCLGPVDAGYLVANGTLRDLPPGSHLDSATGRFTWLPGVGYIGTYRLAFVRGGEQISFAVTIRPRASARPGQSEIRMFVDLPKTGQTLAGTFAVAGWALDPQAAFGSGIGVVDVWARRRDVPGATPVFLGSATLGGARPDLARAFGAQFDAAGFGLTAAGLAPGRYEITVYAWNRRTARWEDARTLTVAVR